MSLSNKLEQLEEVEEIISVSALFEAISEQFEAGVIANTDYYNESEGYECLEQIETIEIQNNLYDIVAMIRYLNSETLGEDQISNRQKCIDNLTAGRFDEIIRGGFGDEFAEVLDEAEIECEEFEVVGRITQDNLAEFDLWCSKVDKLVYERLEFPSTWHIVDCIQENTKEVYDFDFDGRFDLAMMQTNFPADGFLCNYLDMAKDCLEEYTYELETYLNLAIQMTLDWEKRQKENKETTCNE